MSREEKLKLVEDHKKSKGVDEILTRHVNLIINRSIMNASGIDVEAFKQRFRLILNASIARRLI